MDSRTAAHVLDRIAEYLELNGESRFKARAYAQAARAVRALGTDDLRPLLDDGSLEALPGVGPAAVSVVRDLVVDGDSRLLERLRESTPEGMLDMLRVPGLGPSRIHGIHEALGVDSLHELEAAARDGRLATVRGFGAKTAARVLKGIAFLRTSDSLILYPHAEAEAARILSAIREQPGVARAEVAGELRRCMEVVRSIVVVAACTTSPSRVAAAVTMWPGVKDVLSERECDARVRFVDGTLLDLRCVPESDFVVALWRATGGREHVTAVSARAATLGMSLVGDRLLDASGHSVAVPDEQALYRLLHMDYVAPELREGMGEVDAATSGEMPPLLEPADIRGVLHAHSHFSDGESTIEEMVNAARARGWSYLGITDHSQSAFYAGGLSRDGILRQHEEIDRLNATMRDFRVLKGIEADILACGRVDYDGQTLDSFDYVIGSVHSRFGMNEARMTERVLKAMDDPHLTVLGHPTGRLLLAREPYAIDMHAVIERAGERGVAVELNADPHRLDLDWRLCRVARDRGVLVEIGPDAHSEHGLDNMRLGVSIARKGWLGATNVLNTRTADEILSFAATRRAAAS